MRPVSRRCSGHAFGHPAQLGVQLRAVGEVALEGVLDADRDALRLQLQPARIDPARAVAENSADAPGKQAAELASPSGRQRADRGDAAGERDAAPPLARLRAAVRTSNGARKPPRCRRGRRSDPPGLRRSLAIFATTFDVETPSEQVRLVAARTAVCTASATLRAARKSSARPRRRRGSPRRARSVSTVGTTPRTVSHTCLRVLAVERVARAHEDGVRAAPQRLGAAHRRVDAERARDVVRCRDDAASVWVAADDQRLRSECRDPRAPRLRRRTRRGRDGATIMQ